MAPRTRLTLSIVALVGAVVLALSALALHALAEAGFAQVYEAARLTAEQVKFYVVQRVGERTPATPGAGVEEMTAAWRRSVRDDPLLVSYLIRTVAGSEAVVEILVTGAEGEVLATSNPSRAGGRAPAVPDLEAWTAQPAWVKLRQVLAAAHDLELRAGLGAAGGTEPALTVRVVVSSALIRDAVLPQVRNFALAGLLCLVVAGLLAGLLSSLAGRPLARVSELIDRIGEGDAAEVTPPQDPEMAALQSKLALLGERVRGASENVSELRGGMDRMLERLQDAVFLFDPRGKLLLASKAAERYLSDSRWELVGQGIENVFGPGSRLGALVEAASREGKPVRDHRVELERTEGARIQALLTVELIEDFPDRRRLGMIVNLRDAESRRQLASRIDSSVRQEAFGRLLQGVAHEIKNPLNSIYTHLQLLEMQFGDRAPEAAAEMKIIGREIKTLDRMVVTLLDFTKPLELTLDDVDLVELVNEIGGLVRPRAAGSGVEVRVAVERESITVRADRALLRQAVVNVAVNGIEAMEEPGMVRMQVREDGEAALLEVTDEGGGIPPEMREQVFNLYFTTKGKRGSGIGLAMSYRIAQLHGATLDFTTVAGHGTTFRFRFPRAERSRGPGW